MATVSDLLMALHRAGGTVRLDGGDLLLRFPAAPPADLIAALRQRKLEVIAFLRGQAVTRTAHSPAANPPSGQEPEAALSPPLGDRVAALLDKLHAHGCQVEALPDGQTFRADCPTCGMTASLDITESEDGTPHIRAACRCLDPLLALEGLCPAGALPERPRKPKRHDAVCPCGSTTWRDVPIHGGQSIRRDCAVCERSHSFPVWYGHRPNAQEREQLRELLLTEARQRGWPAGKPLPTWWADLMASGVPVTAVRNSPCQWCGKSPLMRWQPGPSPIWTCAACMADQLSEAPPLPDTEP
jgi:hypothetical protein